MSDPLHYKCACPACGVHVEFPEELAGATTQCPGCTASMELVPDLPDPSAEPEAPPATDPLGVSALLGAFGSPGSRPLPSPLYGAGLGLVAAFMVLLPALYVLVIGLAAYGVYEWATHAWGWMGFLRGGGRLYLFRFVLYITPLFAGSVVVLFMIKPLFARWPHKSQPLALNPAAEPKLFAFIAKVCDIVGAPFPKRIDLSCDLNAAASFRRGVASLIGNDLVLTIGLPLVGGLTLQQFAGVLAHEFGHFSQGWGMRLSYVIRQVNFWFARVVAERDELDLWLEGLAAGAESWGVLVVLGAQLAVGFSRLVLLVFMQLGHAVSCFMLRQMEYDADAHEIRVAGSAAFESTMGRLAVLGEVTRLAYLRINNTHKIHRTLPDDLPGFLLLVEGEQPADARKALIDSMGLAGTGVFDTHPSVGDRIRRARRAAHPGVFQLEAPASVLFSNFQAACRMVTADHYSSDLGVDLSTAKLVPVTSGAS